MGMLSKELDIRIGKSIGLNFGRFEFLFLFLSVSYLYFWVEVILV